MIGAGIDVHQKSTTSEAAWRCGTVAV